MVIFFTIKNHLCAGDYAATVCVIKPTQLKQDRTPAAFSSTQEQYPSLFGKRFNFFVIRKATFRTRKRFHNKQYTSKSKDQPLESDRTHFDIEFNNGSIAMHRQTLIFLLSHKITTVQSKTAEINNHINQPQNQSGNTITTNNHSTKYYQKQQSYQSATKTTTTINPRICQTKTRPKQTQQAITKKCNVFEY